MMNLHTEVQEPNEGSARRMMKVIGLRLALPAAILTVVFSAAGRTDGTDTLPKHDLQAKIEYCTDCHGSTGRGYRGFLPMPRLAGQQPAYFEKQLSDFTERRRETDNFINMAKVHGLSPAMRTAVATHFRDLNPGPLGGAPRQQVASGKKIYEEGVPETNVPACLACHGSEAKGTEAIPRLAGQLYPYTIKELKNWSKERRRDPAKNDPADVMEPIAHSLTQSQVAAIAAYLSYLK